MLKYNKRALIASSLLTLLPIPVGLILSARFPERMAVHWGMAGQADGWAEIPAVVWGLPLMMLALHWLCLLATGKDPGNRARNRKIQSLVLWVIPLLSNLSICGIYALALGAEFSPAAWTTVSVGVMFVAFGNYMPKTRSNFTIGIKVPWAYTSEENWNATHRFAGRLWVVGGLLLIPSALLGTKAATVLLLADLLVLSVTPAIYSWRYWKRQKAEGVELKRFPGADKPGAKVSAAVLAVVLAAVVCLLFVGEIRFDFREAYMKVESRLYSDYVLYYDSVDQVEYREGDVPGLRVGGFGTFRLLMGWFENDEFGTYIRYTYYKPEACVVVTAGERTLVLSGETPEQTRQIHRQLLEKIG